VTDAVARVLREKLAAILPEGWRDSAAWGFPSQSELALVAGVFGAQVSTAAVGEVVDQYMLAKRGQMLDDLRVIADGSLKDLIAAVGPRWGDTNVLGVPVLRAQVAHEAAQVLVQNGVISAQDLRDRGNDQELQLRLLKIRGLGQGTWVEIAYMAHVPLLPDARTVALIADLAGEEVASSPEQVDVLLKATARRFAVERRSLDHALASHLNAA
jgi:hypothetical protein